MNLNFVQTIASLPMSKQHNRTNRLVDRLSGNPYAKVCPTQPTISGLLKKMLAPFVDNQRTQQLQEVSSGADLAEVQLQQEAKTNLVISSAGLLLVAGGALFYPPLYMI
ncbi:MAG: hypothetical protein AAF639_34185 [Chloroflexota bacterium]